MTTQLNPYLSFKDNARQAMEFYHSVFGGQLTQRTFKEYHAASDPSEDNNIMHALLTGENGMTLMAADTPHQMEYHPGQNISLSLSGSDESKLREYWNKLTQNAEIQVPLETAPWGDIFGMFTDKFGIHWMVNISKT